MSEFLNLARALSVIDRAGSEAMKSPFALGMQGLPVSALTVPDQAAAERKAAFGKTLINDADGIDIAALPFDIAISLKVALSTATRWSKAADRYWLLDDALGVGFYGMFSPSAYCGGMVLDASMKLMAGQPITRRADGDRYLGLISDLAAIVTTFLDRTKGQADRQIVMPAVQLAQARALVAGLAKGTPHRIGRSVESLGGLEHPEKLAQEIAERIEHEVTPAYAALGEYLAGDYADRAGPTVGLSQYPGGRKLYEELVSHYLTIDLTPEEVHAEGLRRMAEIRGSMRDLRASVGFAGDDAAYTHAVDNDPKWRADTSEGVAEVFRRYMRRLEPHLPGLFNFGAKAGYDVAALPEALAESMTFGYYQAPDKPGSKGLFIYNGVNLTKQGLSTVAALNYHELMPGHHLHLASQMENDLLPPIRKYAFFNAFNEGWAEYSATLAGEVGGYVEPEERFGRMRMDAFLTCRLVVDTGMNALGWTLEQAREYMRENSFMSEQEILTESVRYSCDIPGQALSYKMGDTFLLAERARMQQKLGNAFDIRAFHDAVLRPGALPLPLVGEGVDRAIAEALA